MQEVERRPEIKVVSSQCCYSMLLRLLTVTCGPGQQVVFFYQTFSTHQNRPKPIRIPDSRKGFPWQLSLAVESSLQFSVQQVHPTTSRGWWLRARFRSKRLIHCDFIDLHCASPISKRYPKEWDRISEKSRRSAVQKIADYSYFHLTLSQLTINELWVLILKLWGPAISLQPEGLQHLSREFAWILPKTSLPMLFTETFHTVSCSAMVWFIMLIHVVMFDIIISFLYRFVSWYPGVLTSFLE